MIFINPKHELLFLNTFNVCALCVTQNAVDWVSLLCPCFESISPNRYPTRLARPSAKYVILLLFNMSTSTASSTKRPPTSKDHADAFLTLPLCSTHPQCPPKFPFPYPQTSWAPSAQYSGASNSSRRSTAITAPNRPRGYQRP